MTNSKLDQNGKTSEIKLQRLSFDVPKDLAINIKLKAVKEGVTMRELITNALYGIIQPK